MYFLTHLYNSGYQYGSLNCSRSALSFILGRNITDDDRITKFIKGAFRSRPPAPKYDFTWDTDVVLNYLSNLYPNESLNLEMLSKKLVSLLALVTAHRVQTLSLIQLKNIIVYSDYIIILISESIKTTRPNGHQPILKIPFYNGNQAICPARTLTGYIDKTSHLRAPNINNLFVSYRKPHGKVTSQTLSHWIKDVLHRSGIDTSVFSSHSTRHASTSKANRLGVSMDIIRKTAGWSASSSVFARFYNREIVPSQDETFARSILNRE